MMICEVRFAAGMEVLLEPEMASALIGDCRQPASRPKFYEEQRSTIYDQPKRTTTKIQ
jgi:hypothetical protein